MPKYGLTEKGPNIKRLDVILSQMQEKMTTRLGVNVAQNPKSLLNHTLTNVADQLAELWEFGGDVYYSQYPNSAEGVSLDGAAQFGGSTRELPAKSYYHVRCTGLDGTLIPSGTLVASDTNPATQLVIRSDGQITRAAFNRASIVLASTRLREALGVALNGTLYTITPEEGKSTGEVLSALGDAITDPAFTVRVHDDALVIEAVDEVSTNSMVLSENLTTKEVGTVLTFATVEDGDILIPPGVITKIVKAVAGLTEVVNVGDYIAGQLAETDIEFRKSYTNKIYSRSSRMVESIRSGILDRVQGVLSCAPYENDTNEWDSMGRPPHSVEVVVDGGDPSEIARVILDTKAGGISTFGGIEIQVPGMYGEDIPVRFNRPTYVNVWFRVGVTISRSVNPPTNYVELIKQQIMEKVEALECGGSVLPQRFNLAVPGIDYMDVWMYATEDDGETPAEYTLRSVNISARQRAVTSEGRIGVFIDG